MKILFSLKSYFGVGSIKKDVRHNAIVFYVNSVPDLTNVIIPLNHPFYRYPLLTQKGADF